jgi:hypothetical protein
MKFREVIIGLIMAAVLPTASYAELPSGHYDIPFGQQQGVWDITGSYSDTDVSTTTNFTIVQDDKGKITGNGTTTGVEQGYTVQMNFTAKGAIKSVADVTRVDVTTKYIGTATNGGPIYKITGNVKYSFEIDPLSEELVGTASGKICIQKVGCDSITDTIDYDLPASEDGTWTLALDIVPASNGKNLTGTATATLANGRSEALALSGQYVSSTDTGNLKLKGSAGLVTLRINAVAGNALVQMINAKLLGQKVVGP